MRGRPSLKQIAWKFEFNPPLVRPICQERAPFEQAGCYTVRLQVSGIDHQLSGFATTFFKFQKDAPKHAQLAPADEAVVDCPVWTIAWRDIAPPQSVTNDKDDAADHPPVIHKRDAVREWEERRYARHLSIGKKDHLDHASTPLVQPMNKRVVDPAS